MDDRRTASPGISVVLPAFKCRVHLRPLYSRTKAVLSSLGQEFEIIFVEDCGEDGSVEEILRMMSEDARVRGLFLPRNSGQSSALLAGMTAARGNYVVTMDADEQDPPEAIALLLERVRHGGYAAVFAGRHGPYETAGRRITSVAFKVVRHFVARVPADAGSFVVMTREMAGRVLEYRGRRPFFVSLIGLAGLPVTSLPVKRDKRPAGTSAYSRYGRLRAGVGELVVAGSVRWRRR